MAWTTYWESWMDAMSPAEPIDTELYNAAARQWHLCMGVKAGGANQ